ncbi:MAG: hypothetical protein OXI67_09185 [Candidatus Poribacteria bacterium]|nr:hypothetical protein [Candidatus Poribacteria bacterium]
MTIKKLVIQIGYHSTFAIVLLIFSLLFMCSMVGCGNDEDNTIYDYDRGSSHSAGTSIWHDMDQSERNKEIIQVALNDYGNEVGKSCKVWVQEVVAKATKGHVTVPVNKSEGDSWNEDPDNHVVRYRYNVSPALLGTEPGDIVQMQWKKGVGSSDPKHNMHTAIILSVFLDGVIFIESNYDDTPEDVSDAVVSIRFESEEKFQERVQAFSVYTIR